MQIDQKETADLNIRLQPSPHTLKAYKESADSARTLAWAGIVVGAVGVAAAGGLTVVGNGAAKDLKKDVRAFNSSSVRSSADREKILDDEKKLGTIDMLTVVSGGVGIGALLVGILLYATGEDPDRYDVQTRVGPGQSAVSLDLIPGGAMLTVDF